MFSDIFHVSRLYQCITHSSPSLTASLAILVPKRSQFSEISKSSKSERDSARMVRTRTDETSVLTCLRAPGGPRRKGSVGL